LQRTGCEQAIVGDRKQEKIFFLVKADVFFLDLLSHRRCTKPIRECEKAGGRIISIHSRKAASKILSIIRKYPNCGIPILHWFSGSVSELKEAIEMKCFFSVNPVMIKSEKGKNLVSRIPYGLILPESDGPFTIQNGKTIMPWEAMSICSDLIDIWRLPISDIEGHIKNNLKILLQK
jgi:TatD DNase family protein